MTLIVVHSSRLKLESWVDGLAFEREDAEDAFVDTPQGFTGDETLEGFEAQSELTESKRPLA